VIEDRYSSIFKLQHVRRTMIAEGVAEAQVRFPSVPIVFCESPPLAQEWTYRFLGAAVAHLEQHAAGADLEASLTAAPRRPLGPALPQARTVGPCTST
jgi:hypothetical protein